MKQNSNRRGGLRWYEVLYALILLVLLFFGLVVNKPTRVGVVDLAEVMTELGITDALSAYGQTVQGDIGREIQALQTEYAQSYASITSQVAGTSIEAEIGSLQSDLRRATAQLVTESQRRQQVAVAEYRSRLQPYISEVAKDKGVSLVAVKGSHLAYYRSNVNLTDEVIEAARADAETLTRPLEPESTE